MRLFFAMTTFFLGMSCSNPNVMTTENIKENVTTLKEGTVGTLGGEKVGCSNFVVTDYTTASGKEESGMTASLRVFSSGDQFRVGQGSALSVGESKWKVLSLTAPRKGESGKVALEELKEK